MNYYIEPPTLIGDKIILRKINPEQDNEAFYEIFLDPQMHIWTGNMVPNSKNETYEQLIQYRDLDFLIAWAVIIRATNEFIGTYWVAPEMVDSKKIISTEAQRIGQKYWRKGYTKEARKLVYEFVFTKLEVEEVHAQAWKNNINSCLSMENIGFFLQASEKQYFSKRNEYYYQNHYILRKETWVNGAHNN